MELDIVPTDPAEQIDFYLDPGFRRNVMLYLASQNWCDKVVPEEDGTYLHIMAGPLEEPLLVEMPASDCTAG